MKEIYDVLINFKKIAYEFYEWDKNDNIYHVKTIPSFKVDSSCLLDFLNNNIIVEKSFLNKIKDHTQIFSNRMVKIINYACILFNDNIAIAFLFNDDGNIVGRSKLLFEESDDTISSGHDLKEEKIQYKIISTFKYNKFYTRKEMKKVLNLLNYLDNIYNDKKNEELKYIYYECFNCNEQNVDIIYKKLVKNINDNNFNVISKLNSLLKVLKR